MGILYQGFTPPLDGQILQDGGACYRSSLREYIPSAASVFCYAVEDRVLILAQWYHLTHRANNNRIYHSPYDVHG
jgi:hypothetical protein